MSTYKKNLFGLRTKLWDDHSGMHCWARTCFHSRLWGGLDAGVGVANAVEDADEDKDLVDVQVDLAEFFDEGLSKSYPPRPNQPEC